MCITKILKYVGSYFGGILLFLYNLWQKKCTNFAKLDIENFGISWKCVRRGNIFTYASSRKKNAGNYYFIEQNVIGISMDRYQFTIKQNN